MINALLERLGLEKGEIDSYLYLLRHGPHTAGELAQRCRIIRATQYVFLKRLIEKGFVTQSLRAGKKLFSAVSVEKINALYEERIKNLELDFATFKSISANLTINEQHGIRPKFEIFEGVEGVKNVLKDMLLYKNMETHAYWPINKMLEILSPEFFEDHNRRRIQRNISVRAIWPKKEAVTIDDHPYLGSGEDFLREIRIAPETISFRMGYWIYGNKTAFLSSSKESFGYIIESAELAEMLLSQFEVIWKISKHNKAAERRDNPFIKRLNKTQ